MTLYRSRTVLHLNDLILNRAGASKWQLQGIGHRKLNFRIFSIGAINFLFLCKMIHRF